jgi:hypothetical protein
MPRISPTPVVPLFVPDILSPARRILSLIHGDRSPAKGKN